MIRSIRGLRALGLSALVFGLMAVVASSAHAEGGKWFAGGVELTEKIGVQGTIENSHAILLTKVLNKKVELLCTGGELLGVNLEVGGTLTTGGTILFTGCITKVEGALQEACKPTANSAGLGSIKTNKGKGLLILHTISGGEKVGLTVIEPEATETFVTVELGEKCSIGESLPVRGKLYVKDVTTTDKSGAGKTGLEATNTEHLIEQGTLTDLWVLNKTVEHAATIDGSAKIILAGGHIGLAWKGVPG